MQRTGMFSIVPDAPGFVIGASTKVGRQASTQAGCALAVQTRRRERATIDEQASALSPGMASHGEAPHV